MEKTAEPGGYFKVFGSGSGPVGSVILVYGYRFVFSGHLDFGYPPQISISYNPQIYRFTVRNFLLLDFDEKVVNK